MWSDEKTDTQSSGGLPSINPSLRTHSARAIYRRVRKVLWLQWRGLMIVVFILIDVILFSAVFIYLNAKAKSLSSDYTQALPFLLCLMQHPNDRGLCMNLGQKALMNESTVIAILVILSVSHAHCHILRISLTFLLVCRHPNLRTPIQRVRLHSMGRLLPWEAETTKRVCIAGRPTFLRRRTIIRDAKARRRS